MNVTIFTWILLIAILGGTVWVCRTLNDSKQGGTGCCGCGRCAFTGQCVLTGKKAAGKGDTSS